MDMYLYILLLLAQLSIEGQQLRDNGRCDDVTQRFGRKAFAMQHVWHRTNQNTQT